MSETSNIMHHQAALTIRSSFFDYPYFEGDGAYRQVQKQHFIDGHVWAPVYDYPKLANFHDTSKENPIVAQKEELQNAIFALESARIAGEIDPAKAELFASFNEYRLKRIMFIESAQIMRTSPAGEQRRVAQESFMRLNEALYGQINWQDWKGIMATESARTSEFIPANKAAAQIRTELLPFYERIDPIGNEQKLLDEKLISQYRPLIEKRYASVLDVVPDTPADVIYDAEQSAAIMRRALIAGGFVGWDIEVNVNKTTPSTDAEKQKIYLPANTMRSADELRRLIIHEQEVHARRGYNASRHPQMPLLERGTATYADVEEGLGVFLEMILSGSTDAPAIHRARDRYITAGLALGVEGQPPRDARATFEILWRMLAIRQSAEGSIDDFDIRKAKNAAYGHIENAFRGTSFVTPGIVYTKLKIYYEGLVKNVEYAREINADPERFEEMFVGKYNHTDPTERTLILSSIDRKSA